MSETTETGAETPAAEPVTVPAAETPAPLPSEPAAAEPVLALHSTRQHLIAAGIQRGLTVPESLANAKLWDAWIDNGSQPQPFCRYRVATRESLALLAVSTYETVRFSPVLAQDLDDAGAWCVVVRD